MMFDQIVDSVSAALWELAPRQAVYLGRHEYDGRVPDWSEPAVDAQLDRLENLRGRLATLPALDPAQELDRLQLGSAIDETLFDWRTMRSWRRDPMQYVFPLGVDLYLTRRYAPIETRVEKVAEVLEDAPVFLELARDNLDPALPRVYCEWAMRTGSGLRDSLGDDLREAVGDVRNRPLQTRLFEAADSAQEALGAFCDWIEQERLPASDDAFAIGGESLEELVMRSELVSIGIDELLAMAEQDLEANQEAFGQAAAKLDPGGAPREIYEREVAADHPTAEGLIPAAAAVLEEIRSFIVDKDLITIPSDVRALVAETPRHLRWAFAMMSTPGPYETEATEAFYYVTPVDPAWSRAEQEEWLKAFNTFNLEDISIHEAYPGHYVHFLHFQTAPTETAKRFASYAFSEGWAHYTEQMMWEAGYREGDPRFRMAQLIEALVRDCRFVCSVKMHAMGMTVDEATRFFIDNAYYEEKPARQEAERGTFDPGYLSYTLGKLQILQLRDEYRRKMGTGYSMKEFHDALLSRGAPPVEIMRRVMLD